MNPIQSCRRPADRRRHGLGHPHGRPAGGYAPCAPADWEPADPVELLGPPRVVTRGGSADIAYPVVIWRAGTAHPGGARPVAPRARTAGWTRCPPTRVTVQVASVLPPRPGFGAAAPAAGRLRPAVTDRSPLVPLVLLALAILLLLPLHWWWRRRGRPRPPAAGQAAAPPSRRSSAGPTTARPGRWPRRPRCGSAAAVAAPLPSARARAGHRRACWPHLRAAAARLAAARAGGAAPIAR